MDEPIMSFDGNGQSDILSLINSEAEKVKPANKVSPSPPAVQVPASELPESLPAPPDQPKETSHLKASTFAEPVLPIDWLSESVQEYIRTVSESYGCRWSMWWSTVSSLLASRQGKRHSSSPTLIRTTHATFSAWWVNPAGTRQGL